MSGEATLFEAFEIPFSVCDKKTAAAGGFALYAVGTIKAYSLFQEEYSTALG